MTRQRRWQLAQKAAGNCVICGQPRGESRSADRCALHHEDVIARQRQRLNQTPGGQGRRRPAAIVTETHVAV